MFLALNGSFRTRRILLVEVSSFATYLMIVVCICSTEQDPTLLHNSLWRGDSAGRSAEYPVQARTLLLTAVEVTRSVNRTVLRLLHNVAATRHGDGVPEPNFPLRGPRTSATLPK